MTEPDPEVPVLVALPDGTERPAVQPDDPPFRVLRETRDDDYTPEALDRAVEE